MLNLTIETTDNTISLEINNAYNKALNTTNLNDFEKSLKDNIYNDIQVGRSGSHFWISSNETGERYAIIII